MRFDPCLNPPLRDFGRGTWSDRHGVIECNPALTRGRRSEFPPCADVSWFRAEQFRLGATVRRVSHDAGRNGLSLRPITPSELGVPWPKRKGRSALRGPVFPTNVAGWLGHLCRHWVKLAHSARNGSSRLRHQQKVSDGLQAVMRRCRD